MARPTFEFIIRWGAGAVGSPSNFDPPSVEVADDTDYDDISALVESCTIRRGQADPYQAVTPGTCTLTVLDQDGMFVPGNDASPLVAGGYLARYKTLRVTGAHASFGSSNGRYYGYLRRVIPDPVNQRATLEFVDGLHLMTLGLHDGFDGTPGGSTTSATLALLVAHRFDSQYVYDDSAAGNAFTAEPSLDPGEAISGLTADLLAAERGIFFHSREGVWMFLDRYWHDRDPRDEAQGSLTDVEVVRLSTGFDADAVKNRATVTRTGGTPQTVTAASVDFPSDWGTLTTDYLDTDAQALATANWIIAQQGSDVPAAYACDLDGDFGDTVTGQLLMRELYDRVTLDAIRVGEADYFIIGMEETIARNRKHTARWTLLRRDAARVGFVFGYSGFGNAAFG